MTHITYKVSKKLKEFLGDSAPETIENKYIGPKGSVLGQITGRDVEQFKLVPTYTLEDLLSKPFCEAFAKAEEDEWTTEARAYGIGVGLHVAYWHGGMKAVERCLCEMMEAK